jgi:hypothetical protein
MPRLAIITAVSALTAGAQAQPAVDSIANVEAYVAYVRLVAKARDCGLRNAEWETLQHAKLATLIGRAVSAAGGTVPAPDGASLAAGAVIAAGQEARSFPRPLCETLQPLIDELDAALPSDSSAQR